MADSRRNKFNFILLFLAVVGAALFYGCGGVGSDIVPESQCVVTGTIRPSTTLESYLLSSLRGATANMAGVRVWVEADGYGSAVLTDENGNYTITTRPNVSRVVAEYSSTEGKTYLVWSDNISFQRRADANTVSDLTLKIANVQVKGKIVSSNGAALSGSNVGISLLGRTIYPEADGTYILPLMPEGEKETITVAGGGYQSISQIVAFNENSPTIENTIVTNSETNRAPVITSISNSSAQNNINKQRSVTLQVNFSDPDSNIATWSWNITPSDGVSIGSFTAQEGDKGLTYSRLEWRSPNNDTLATITFTVSDIKGLTAKSMFFFNVGNGIPNNPPQILGITKERVDGAIEEPDFLQGRQSYRFSVQAYDPDAGDMAKLKYKWSCEYNGINWTKGFDENVNGTASASEIAFRIASNTGTVNRIATITVKVLDGKSDWVSRSAVFNVSPDPAYSIPTISEVAISVNDDIDASGSVEIDPAVGGVQYIHLKSYSNYLVVANATVADEQVLLYDFIYECDEVVDKNTGVTDYIRTNFPTEGGDRHYRACVLSAGKYTGQTEALATLTVKVYGVDKNDESEILTSTEKKLSLKIAANPDRLTAPEIEYTKYPPSLIERGGVATVTVRLADSRKIEKYRWRYYYTLREDLQNPRNPTIGLIPAPDLPLFKDITGDTLESKKTVGKNKWVINSGVGSDGWVSVSTTSVQLAFSDKISSSTNEIATGACYYLQLEIKDQYSQYASSTTVFSVNGRPVLNGTIDSSSYREMTDVNDSTKTLKVVNEGIRVTLNTSLQDDKWDIANQHDVTWKIGNSATDTSRLGNPFSFNVNDAKYALSAGNSISISAVATISINVDGVELNEFTNEYKFPTLYYNASPTVTEISFEPAISHAERECYIPELEVDKTYFYVEAKTEDQEENNKIGKGNGSVRWEYKKDSGSYTSFPTTVLIASNSASLSDVKNAGRIKIPYAALGEGSFQIRATIADSYGGEFKKESDVFTIAKQNEVEYDPAPVAYKYPVVDNDNNVNPTIITKGTKINLIASYSDTTAISKIKWEYKVSTSGSFNEIPSTAMTTNEGEVSAVIDTSSFNSLSPNATYTFRVSVTGKHNDVASASYDAFVNTKPKIPSSKAITVIVDGSPAASPEGVTYQTGKSFTAIMLKVTDPEDYGTTSEQNISPATVALEGHGAKLEFWYSTQDNGANPVLIDAYPWTGVVAHAHEYRLIASYTDCYGSHISTYTSFYVSDPPVIELNGGGDAEGYNQDKLVSEPGTTPIYDLRFKFVESGTQPVPIVDQVKEINLSYVQWAISEEHGTKIVNNTNFSGSKDTLTAHPNYRYTYNAPSPGVGTFTYYVKAVLTNGKEASVSKSVYINQKPRLTTLEVVSGTGTEMQSSPKVYKAYETDADTIKFSVKNTDNDKYDMPKFIWTATKEGGLPTTFATYEYTNDGSGDTKKKDTSNTVTTDISEWKPTEIGTYTISVKVIDAGGESDTITLANPVVIDKMITSPGMAIDGGGDVEGYNQNKIVSESGVSSKYDLRFKYTSAEIRDDQIKTIAFTYVQWARDVDGVQLSSGNISASKDPLYDPHPKYRYTFDVPSPGVGTFTFYVKTDFTTGQSAETSKTVYINQKPKLNNIQLVSGSGTELQSSPKIYKAGEPIKFSVVNTDNDKLDMPKFTWKAKKDGEAATTIVTNIYTNDGSGGTIAKDTTSTTVTDVCQWTPAEIGSYTISVTVTDVGGETDTISLANVVAVDSPITIVSFTGPDNINNWVYEARNYIVTLNNVTDPRTIAGLAVKYQIGNRGMISGVTDLTGARTNGPGANQITGTFSPDRFSSSSAVGEKSIRITLTDQWGLVASTTYDIYVNGKPTLNTFKLYVGADTPSKFDTDTEFRFKAEAKDDDPADALTFKFYVKSKDGVLRSPKTELSSIPVADNSTNKSTELYTTKTGNTVKIGSEVMKTGVYVFSCEVVDSKGQYSEEKEVTVTVNTAPKIDSFTYTPTSDIKYAGKETFLWSAATSMNFTVTVSDTSGDNYNYKWLANNNNKFADVTNTSLTNSQSYLFDTVGLSSAAVIITDPLGSDAMASTTFYVFRTYAEPTATTNDVKDIITYSQGDSSQYFAFVGGVLSGHSGDLGSSKGLNMYRFPLGASPQITISDHIASYSSSAESPATPNYPSVVCATVRPNGKAVSYSSTDHKLYIYKQSMTSVATNSPGYNGGSKTPKNEIDEVACTEALTNLAATNDQIFCIKNSIQLGRVNAADGSVTTSRSYSSVKNLRCYESNFVGSGQTNLYVIADNKVEVLSTSESVQGTYNITNAVDAYAAKKGHLFVLTSDGKIVIVKSGEQTTLNCGSAWGSTSGWKSLCYFREAECGYLLAYNGSNHKMGVLRLGLPKAGEEW